MQNTNFNNDYFMINPVLLVSEVFYWQSDNIGLHEQIMDKIVQLDFYRGIETAIINNPQERKKLYRLLQEYDYSLTQWLTKSLLERDLSISDLNNSMRKQAIGCVKECIDQAVECGANKVGIVSGPAPKPELLNQAKKYLQESLCIIAEYTKQYDIELVVEPLDRDQHKKQVLGPYDEAVEILKSLRAIYNQCSLCWDSAHIAIMGEDLKESIISTKGYVSQWHLADAVLDKNDNQYGDYHMMIGQDGFLKKEVAGELLEYALTTGAIESGIKQVGVEVRTDKSEDPWKTEERCRQYLNEVFVLAKGGDEI